MLKLVLGGTRSGKSAVAERLVAEFDKPVTYVATASVIDPDFAARVAAHQARRPSSWTTVETSNLTGALEALEGAILIDSLGTWLAAHEDFAVDVESLVGALKGVDAVVVSEEVGLGIHPVTEVGRRFADALGLVNQAVAAVADEVLLVVAGRVLELR